VNISLIKGENNRSPFNPPNEPRGCIWQKAKGPRPDITVCVNNREVEDTDRRVVHRTNLSEKKGGTKKYLHGIIIEGGLMMGTKMVGVLSSPHKRTIAFISKKKLACKA